MRTSILNKNVAVKQLFLLIFTFIYFPSFAQEIVCDKISKELFLKKQHAFHKKEIIQMPVSERVIAIAKSFMDTEYVAKTLDVNTSAENLVVSLDKVDCTTFLEYVVALNYTIQQDDSTFNGFLEALENFRYRDGEVKGYASRLHYFSEWLQDNEKKGLLSVVSKELGGVPMNKQLNFMSTHAKSYPQLVASKENQKEIENIEQQISPQEIYFLPQATIKKADNAIQNGDLIALSTSINGLDVVHVGFAIKVNNKTHLLHASTTGMKVEISDKTIAEMVNSNKIQNGIVVARLTN